MTYDNWKTTNPEDERLGSTMPPRSTRMQCAADDAGAIADELECLGNLLDRFWENHGEELGSKLMALMPWQVEVNRPLAKKVADFARSLEPPEDR
jgi:hypothetical protein